jgi:Bacterial regulatory protein, Fis family
MNGFEKMYLTKALKRFRGRINHTARQIGMSKATLIRRLRAHEITPDGLFVWTDARVSMKLSEISAEFSFSFRPEKWLWERVNAQWREIIQFFSKKAIARIIEFGYLHVPRYLKLKSGTNVTT